jgi:hypothetical protein
VSRRGPEAGARYREVPNTPKTFCDYSPLVSSIFSGCRNVPAHRSIRGSRVVNELLARRPFFGEELPRK